MKHSYMIDGYRITIEPVDKTTTYSAKDLSIQEMFDKLKSEEPAPYNHMTDEEVWPEPAPLNYDEFGWEKDSYCETPPTEEPEKKQEVVDTVSFFLTKASNAYNADEALKWTQCAMNVEFLNDSLKY